MGGNERRRKDTKGRSESKSRVVKRSRPRGTVLEKAPFVVLVIKPTSHSGKKLYYSPLDVHLASVLHPHRGEGVKDYAGENEEKGGASVSFQLRRTASLLCMVFNSEWMTSAGALGLPPRVSRARRGRAIKAMTKPVGIGYLSALPRQDRDMSV